MQCKLLVDVHRVHDHGVAVGRTIGIADREPDDLAQRFSVDEPIEIAKREPEREPFGVAQRFPVGKSQREPKFLAKLFTFGEPVTLAHREPDKTSIGWTHCVPKCRAECISVDNAYR